MLQYKVPLILGCIVLVFVVLGTGLLIVEKRTDPLVESIEIQANQKGSIAGSNTSMILVDIAGAISNPGLYELPAHTRIGDLIETAGGVTDEADSAWIARSLNKAEKLRDGMKIYIPIKGQGADINSDNVKSDRKISLNTASQSELESLPGIGPKSAEKIIQARPIHSIDELLTRKIVGKSTYEKIKEQVSVW